VTDIASLVAESVCSASSSEMISFSFEAVSLIITESSNKPKDSFAQAHKRYIAGVVFNCIV